MTQEHHGEQLTPLSYSPTPPHIVVGCVDPLYERLVREIVAGAYPDAQIDSVINLLEARSLIQHPDTRIHIALLDAQLRQEKKIEAVLRPHTRWIERISNNTKQISKIGENAHEIPMRYDDIEEFFQHLLSLSDLPTDQPTTH